MRVYFNFCFNAFFARNKKVIFEYLSTAPGLELMMRAENAAQKHRCSKPRRCSQPCVYNGSSETGWVGASYSPVRFQVSSESARREPRLYRNIKIRRQYLVRTFVGQELSFVRDHVQTEQEHEKSVADVAEHDREKKRKGNDGERRC